MVYGGRQLTDVGGPWVVVMILPVKSCMGEVKEAMGGGREVWKEGDKPTGRRFTPWQLVSAGAAGCGNKFSSDSEDEGYEGWREQGKQEEKGKRGGGVLLISSPHRITAL
ncbi:hypothetical protein E2C01_090169 [Portunus trituberculatus]|uniref:Uncharacterized protein n=1 Tax=Portunus trituberculatus TaxID=210409 RepID=A0A5B7JPD8_PORTR|nr:hypothetical protein [Portunus trituberculatus]